ncbi:type II secretion system protein N [Acinetobacter ihumii]|uniref:type II secretion system protein N n=1 Tax=Acinetobacter ihumii TaxID=2483802 RepID=UPI0010325E5E|nr:type II secretion system protein N [Acinetobacter ihumii]
MKKKSKHLTWWIFAVIAFLVFVVLQIPANWLISKFSKNNQTLSNVSGNIWQGQADWRKGDLHGSIHWNSRPLDLFLLRVGADVEIHSANTQLNGVLGYGFGKKLIIRQFNGQIAPETLKTLVNWQWPANSIQLKDVELNYQKEKGFAQAEGQLHWGGGELIYTFAQRQERMNMPSLQGKLQDSDGRLNITIDDQRSQKMANLALDQNLMLDVQLTQRLLLNVPSYEGKAGLDTYVISTRQPLFSGGF